MNVAFRDLIGEDGFHLTDATCVKTLAGESVQAASESEEGGLSEDCRRQKAAGYCLQKTTPRLRRYRQILPVGISPTLRFRSWQKLSGTAHCRRVATFSRKAAIVNVCETATDWPGVGILRTSAGTILMQSASVWHI